MLKLGLFLLLFWRVSGDNYGDFSEINLFDNLYEIFKWDDIVKQGLVSTDIGKTCGKHLKEFINGLSNYSYWAIRMLDSMEKIPTGIFMGQLLFPGHFDECTTITEEEFTGKHCPAMFVLDSAEKNYKVKTQTLVMLYGICVPSTCNATDIMNIVHSVEGFYVNVTVTESQCSLKGYRPLRKEDWICIGILITVTVIALLSTAYDVIQIKQFKNEKPNQVLSSFSLYTNWINLFKISDSPKIKSLHGIRCLTLSWVILGHTYYVFVFSPMTNAEEINKGFNSKSLVPITNAVVSVDSFFFLSGLLVCTVFFRDISKKGSFDVPVAFIHRYIRLTPLYATIILIHSTIVSRIGNGPYWNRFADQQQKLCRESWWSGMLFIENFFKPQSLCLGQSWYLSADMQMYWLSPFILYPILLLPSFAPFFICIGTSVAVLVNFAVAFINHLQPSYTINFGEYTRFQFEREYSVFYSRMSPWFIGLGTGYVIYGMKSKKIHLNFSKTQATILWILSLALLGSSLFSVARFLPAPKTPYTNLESSLYHCLHRAAWALGMSWLVIACAGGYGGLVNDFLSLNMFQPLGKLSYCAFLIHMTVQQYRVFTSRLNQYVYHQAGIWGYCGDLILSIIISIPLYLLFEIPFTRLDRILIKKIKIFPYPITKPETDKPNEAENKRETYRKLEKDFDIEMKTVPVDSNKTKTNPGFNISDGIV